MCLASRLPSADDLRTFSVVVENDALQDMLEQVFDLCIDPKSVPGEWEKRVESAAYLVCMSLTTLTVFCSLDHL